MIPRVFIVALTMATLTYATITYFEKKISDRRQEQLRIARLDNHITVVLGDLDSLLLGEAVENIDDDLRKMNREFSSITKSSEHFSAKSVQAAMLTFTSAVAKERSAVHLEDMALARADDRRITDPNYDRLKRELTAVDEELESEVVFWKEVVDGAILLSLMSSALLVACFVVRSQKRAEQGFVREAQQESVAASERRLKSLIQNCADVFALMSGDGVLTMVSDACEKAWGRSAAEIVGGSIYDSMEAADALRLRRLLAELLRAQLPFPTLEVSMNDGRGGVRPFEVHLSNLLDDPSVSAVLLTFHDLAERKEYESQMAYHAFHDRLTGLPNRALFLDRLSHRLKATENGEEGFAVLFIDLDNFKIINDSLGHEAGDTLLIEIAARLQASMRPTDTVARLGGDEFTIILDGARRLESAVETAERIQKTLLLPVRLGEREVFVTCSIGIVMTQDSGPDAAGLLRDADTAMYQAKGDGKAALAVFDRSMNVLAIDRLELESDLRVAIQEEQFYLTYQPIVDIDSSRLCEVEALIRWQHPTRGLIPPMMFIPLAEETGLICAIGRWALRDSFAQLKAWNRNASGDERLHLSVNVSPRQLQEKDFVGEVQSLLEELELDPSLVELEVTETAMLNDLVKMKGVFMQLRALGLRVAIDDFGTGYSSMAYLSQLPVDKLKIDRSFVISLGEDNRTDGVVQAMITMARTLGLGITGEGVETQKQLSTLQDMGCDFGQGFLFDRPLSAESVSQLLSGPGRMPSLDALPMAA